MDQRHHNKKAGSGTVSGFFLVFGALTGLIHSFQPDPILKLAGVVFLTISFVAWWPKLQRDDLQEVSAKGLAIFSIVTISLFFFIEGAAGLTEAMGLVAKSAEVLIVLAYLVGILIAGRQKKAAVVYAAIPRDRRPAATPKRFR